MSDIYLQIAETPTVVTLSAPVISGALSSTVTVANTVTVALDANSLSALENVTVTVGAAVSISNLPATQTIAGTVTANAGYGFPAVIYSGILQYIDAEGAIPVGIGSALPAGTNRIGVVTIGGGTVTIGAGTAQIGSVTASISNDFVAIGEQIAEGINNYSTIPVAVNWQDANQGIGNLNVTATCVTSTNRIGVVTIGGGTVTIGAGTAQIGSVNIKDASGNTWGSDNTWPVVINSGNVNLVSSIPAGTNRIGVVTIGGGTVTIGAGTAQIGSVTASISGTVPVSGTFWQATQPASLASLPALAAGTAQIGSVTASISNSVVTFYPLQGTTVSNTNFTSITASTTLVSAVANREVLTVFNEGAGNLHISPGATCTTVAYQVRLSAGDYWECPAGQLSLAHAAVFATAGTARVTQVS
jgi:hypothetical protein